MYFYYWVNTQVQPLQPPCGSCEQRPRPTGYRSACNPDSGLGPHVPWLSQGFCDLNESCPDMTRILIPSLLEECILDPQTLLFNASMKQQPFLTSPPPLTACARLSLLTSVWLCSAHGCHMQGTTKLVDPTGHHLSLTQVWIWEVLCMISGRNSSAKCTQITNKRVDLTHWAPACN